MSFVKSIMPDESTQVYFDSFDNKHIRKNGTLAWRCNNPGLVHSHSNIASKQGSIGHHGQYHVFPNVNIGRKALISWVQLLSYYLKPLLAIAQFQNPNDPESYLLKLCSLSNLDPKDVPFKLTGDQFNKLIWAIEELAGGHSVLGNESFYQLPKIVGRFISRNKKIDLYLIADGRILSKGIAISEVKDEKIDAVVVHLSDGTEYLRSRPGHVLSQINIPSSDKMEDTDFKTLVREDGVKREGQVIWGFINGIFNYPSKAKSNLALLVRAVNGEQVWGLINDSGVKQCSVFSDTLTMKFGFTPEFIKVAFEYINFLIMLSDEDPKRPPIVIIAHSQGALIAEFVVRQMSPSIQKRIQIWTLGGAGFVPDGTCAPGTCNYINQHDTLVRATSPNDYRLLTIRDQYENMSHEYIADLIAEGDALVQGLDFGAEYETYKRGKFDNYKKRLAELNNTRIIYCKKEWGTQHGFDDPHYQGTLKDLVKKIYEKR